MRVLFVMVMFLFFNFLVSSDNNNNNLSRQKLTEESRTRSFSSFPRDFRKLKLAETQKSNSFGPSTVGMQIISQGNLGSVSKESLGTNSPRLSPRSRKANSDESDSRGSSSPKSMLQKQSENPERFDQSPPPPPSQRRAHPNQNLPSPNNNK